jgi:uncharacterized protein YbjT (DUF2867 family)
MILVIGATGFIGRHLVTGLLARGEPVRALVRDVARARQLLGPTVDLAPGDMLDAAAVGRAMADVRAVYVSVQTVTSRQPSATGAGFAEAEDTGLQNIVAASRATGARRLVALGVIGTSPTADGAWARARAATEQWLVTSGLDVTILRPGLVVGVGSVGFDGLVAAARKPIAIVRGHGRQVWRTIAIEDLVSYLLAVLDEPRTSGQVYDVGGDELLTYDQLVDATAHVLGRRPPSKLHLPLGLLASVAGLLERVGRLPGGGLRAAIDHLNDDLVGDPRPIRAVLPGPLIPFRVAAAHALGRAQPGQAPSSGMGIDAAVSSPRSTRTP